MTTTVTVRTDKAVKEQAQEILSSLGMDMTTAVNIYLRQIIRTEGIPFEVKRDTPNQRLQAAMNEAERLLKGPMGRVFDTPEALFENLDA